MISQKNHRFKQCLSLLLVLFMLLSVAIIPTPVKAEKGRTVDAQTALPLNSVSERKPSEKLSSVLTEELKSDDQVEAMIYMKSKLDPIAFAEQAKLQRKNTLSSTSQYDINLQVRRDLVFALKDKAHNTQYNLRDIVDRAGDDVSDFKSYFITNAAYIKATPEVIKAIAELPEVETITENKKYKLDDFKVEDTTVQAKEENWNLEMVRAPEAWDLLITGKGAVVGLVDTGVDYMHPALRENWRGQNEDGTEDAKYSWYDPAGLSQMPGDYGGHGTHVCGTMVGRDKEAGITTGVAPEAKWIAARVFDYYENSFDSWLLSAAEWMLAPGDNPDMAPDVVNNSWSSGSDANEWYQDAVNAYIAADIVPVFAAGNQGDLEPVPGPGTIMNPAHYENTLAVTAIDNNKKRADFAKRGPSPFTDAIKPELSAPGVGVYSTMPDGEYAPMSGTSMAAPHVSGLVALIRSADQSLTYQQIRERLIETAEPLTDDDPNARVSPNYDYGYGLIDSLTAVLPYAQDIGYFTGKVLQEGSDTQEPVITHTQQVDEIFLGHEIEVIANIKDDVSVVDAFISVRSDADTWTDIPMKQVNGDATGGDYKAFISPTAMGTGDSIDYKIVAVDYAGNRVETDLYHVVVKFGVIPGEYLESFEGSAEGWRLDDIWQIGKPVLPQEPAVSDGEQYLATFLGEMYIEDQNGYVVSPPIDLRDADEASVRFLHWHSLTEDYDDDYGKVYVTNDYGETLHELKTYNRKSGRWLGEVIDLSEYAHSATPVNIVFQFFTDAWSNDYGWYIDQFTVEGKDTTAPGMPRNLTALPGLSSIRLTWDFDLVADLKEFQIYRSTVAGEEGELVGTAIDTIYLDNYDNLADDTDYFYTVKAVDYAGNVSDASTQVVARKNEEVNYVKKWDFETNDGGFTTGNLWETTKNDWEWGRIGGGHGPGSAFSGSRVWATGLWKDYSPGTDAYLQTPEIAVPAAGASFLTMNHWYKFDQSDSNLRKWDYAQILAKTTDSDLWINITPPDENEVPGDGKFGGPLDNVANVWHYLELDMTEYAGKTLELRFYYHTDNYTNYPGWFLNDVNFINVSSEATGAALGSVDIAYAVEPVETRIADFSLDFSTVGAAKVDEEIVDIQKEYDPNGSYIPVPKATVSALETGRVVKADQRTGDYFLIHKASDEGQVWTIKADAYGFVPEQITATLADQETHEHIFVLEKMAAGSISGKVYDRYSKEPAVGAEVTIMEDPNIAPAITDENGAFTFEKVYIGDYTLRAVHKNFVTDTVEVTVEADKNTEKDIPLRRFVGVPGEIKYDDGKHENALVLMTANSGIAVRFTPETFGQLVSASLYFFDETWPNPGGNEIGFAVFVRENNKLKQIGKTKVRNDIVRGDWYTIDLSDLNFSTADDFYITTVQTKPGNYSPAVGLDDSATDEISARSYFFGGDDMVDFPSSDYGGTCAMIRANMLYSADTPMITNLGEVTYTNETEQPVEGTVGYDKGEVLVYANEDVADTITPEELDNNTFKTTLTLTEEETVIKAALKVGEQITEPTPDKLVILDQVVPSLVVDTPAEGDKFNVEVVHVTGKVYDKHLDKLLINGEEVTVNEDGTYDYSLIVTEGENPVEIIAIDKAGNETVEKRTVNVELEGVMITDMKPAEDVTVHPGDPVTVSFRAPAGGNGAYQILPPTGLQNVAKFEPNMTEVEPGLYQATWTAGDVLFDKGDVVFEYSSAYGNYTSAMAPGKISVVERDLTTRVAGGTRYATAVEMSKLMYESADTVILASGENFPDALVGGTYAEAIDAPVLLTRQADLPIETLTEIHRLGAKQVKILGGELAISKEVERALKYIGIETERIAGGTRYHTAVKIAERARKQDSTHVFLACGSKFEDALGIVPAAARQDDALLLTATDKLSKATKDAMAEWNTETVTLMGGKLVISEAVEQELKDLGYKVDRIQGMNRYATNIDIATTYFPEATEAVGASGVNFPDALVATVYAAKHNAPIILLNPEGLANVTVEYFKTQPIKHVLLMGGEIAIPKTVEYHIRGLIRE